MGTFIKWGAEAERRIKEGGLRDLCRLPTLRVIVRDAVADAARIRHERENRTQDVVADLEVGITDVMTVERIMGKGGAK